MTYGYHGGYCWCKKRKFVPSAYGRKRANLLGFLNHVTFETTSIMNDSYLNLDIVCDGLERLRKRYPDQYLYIILDNAAYQHCRKVRDKAEKLNINLVFLPPYSPNLNLIERLWKFLRKELLANNFFKSFKTFYSEIESFICSLHLEHTDKLSSLLTPKFELFDSSIFNDCLIGRVKQSGEVIDYIKELIDEGYISKVSVMGHISFSCTIIEKGFEMYE